MTKFIDIQQRLVKARKEKDMLSIRLLSTIIGDLQRGGDKVIDDTDASRVIRKHLEHTNFNIDKLTKKNFTDTRLYALHQERETLESLLPASLSDAELFGLAIQHPNIRSYMLTLAADFAGQYDGKRAAALYKEAHGEQK